MLTKCKLNKNLGIKEKNVMQNNQNLFGFFYETSEKEDQNENKLETKQKQFLK